MPACAFILMLVMLSLAIISLIGLWKSDSVLGLKWSVTFMLLMVVICFYTSFRNEPFEIEDEVAFIGVIATIVSIPVAVLIGWNIYTAVDFNRKAEKAEEKVKKEVESIKEENQKIKQDYQELKKNLEYTQSDMTFASIFNNTIILDKESNDNFVQYIFDGYMDALDVAIRDNLTNDRVEEALTRLVNLTQRYTDLTKSKFPILPDRNDYYNKILLNDRLVGEKVEKIKAFFKDGTIEAHGVFPPTYVRIVSRYNPDNIV